MFQKATLVALVALFSNLAACTSTAADTETPELGLQEEKLDTFGELEEDSTAYPWINSDDSVHTDTQAAQSEPQASVAPQRKMAKASLKPASKKKKKK